jgi:hypothetical protein
VFVSTKQFFFLPGPSDGIASQRPFVIPQRYQACQTCDDDCLVAYSVADPPRNSQPRQARESDETKQMSKEFVIGHERQNLRRGHYQDCEELIDDAGAIFAVFSPPLERGILSK